MGLEIRASAGKMTSGARHRLAAVAVAAALVLPSACALNQEGVPPPKNDIFFPAGGVVDGTGRWLFVTNSNSDLRYNDGTLVAVDLEAAGADRAKSWSSCPKVGYLPPSSQSPQDPAYQKCCWDYLDRLTLNCDSRAYVDATSTIRIGSFGGTVVLQPSCDDQAKCPTTGRLFVSVRGNSSITWLDSDVGRDPGTSKLTCSATNPSSDECATDHRVTQRPGGGTEDSPSYPTVDAAKVTLPEEPYALALDHQDATTTTPDSMDARDWLLVGHLRGGAVSLIDANKKGMPRLIGWYGAIVPVDSNGLRGITSLIKDSVGGGFYAGSRYLARVVGLQMTGRGDGTGAATLDNIALVGNGQQYVSNLAGSETRGIQFITAIEDDPFKQPNLAFVLQRVPPALLGFQAANGQPTDILETCNSPTFLNKHGTGVNLRLYVTCFEDGEVYVFDPRVPRLVDIIEVGRGPAGLVFPPGDDSTPMFVVGFGANNISVVDIQPGSPTENHVVQRIGFPSPVPR